jgi:hypothetical protein
MNNVSSTTAGYTIAAIIAVIANTLLVWAKETNPALLALMKTAIHHWFVHGVAVTVVFLALGLVFSKWRMRNFNGTFLALLLGLATVASGLGIVGFYFIHG